MAHVGHKVAEVKGFGVLKPGPFCLLLLHVLSFLSSDQQQQQVFAMYNSWREINVCFDSYYVMNNWHLWLSVLIFGDYCRSGFGDNQFSGDDRIHCYFMWPVRPGGVCRSDRWWLSGQTGRPTVWPADAVLVSVSGCFFGYPWLFHGYGF